MRKALLYSVVPLYFLCALSIGFASEPLSLVTPPVQKVFGIAEVEAIAGELAQHPYQSPDGVVPPFLRELNLNAWQAIRFRSDKALWKNQDSPFEIRFHHPGFIYNRIAAISIIEAGKVSPFRFTPDLFLYGDETLPGQVQSANMGFAGFSLYTSSGAELTSEQMNGLNGVGELAIFLGASYFRSNARHSVYGLSARALALNTALPNGEEFPYFRQFWLVKPKPEDTSFTMFALMDSPSMVGAFRMVITPGLSTVMDVDARLFQRSGVPIPEKIGIAPLTSMFLHSETDNGKPGDYRPEIHNSDGLLYMVNNEWIWCPLANPARLMVNTFGMSSPHGFGLMQRDDDFDHYQDLTARYDRRPSLWIEPKGDWGAGRLELVLIPGQEDYHGNIVAFWVSESADAFAPAVRVNNNSGNGTEHAAGQGMQIGYRMYWMTPGVTPHNLGKAVATRVLRSPNSDNVSFIIDFEGEAINSLHANVGVTSVVDAPEHAPLIEKRIVKNSVTGGWRLFLTFRIPKRDGVMQSLFTARDGAEPIRFKALLKRGENLPDALTETWIYHLVP